MKERLEAGRRMRELIRQEPSLLMVLRRFGISLGFGNATADEVCRTSGVDTGTFLAVANFVCGCPYADFAVSLPELIRYLKNSHDYFLDFALPAIRRRLLEAVPVSGADGVGMLLLRYLDDYIGEVRAHMEYENSRLFPYVKSLLEGMAADDFSLAEFSASHAPLAPKLEELKEIFVSHYRGSGNEDLVNAVLFDIITCENDLMSHCRLEDRLFVPAVEDYRENLPAADRADETASGAPEDPALTARETEIVRCIARGLSNKEIAAKLFVSIHTVTTHRRNICAKFDIHSASALTIYAIIHRLVDLSELRAPRISDE